VQFAAFKRQERGRILGGLEEHAIDALEQCDELALVGRVEDDDAAPLLGRKAAVVEVITIHGHERTAQLLRQAEMLEVRRATEPILFEDEQDVPLEPGAHELDEAGWHPLGSTTLTGIVRSLNADGTDVYVGTDQTWAWREPAGEQFQAAFWRNVVRYLAGRLP